MPTYTSQRLTVGHTYSRAQLGQLFNIQDATLNNGIFRPKDTDSVWLFITEKKTADRTQYQDHLDGDELRFEGQTTGRTDHLIEHHARNGLELLVFHREKKDERPDYSFRYEGPFVYVSKASGPPTRFSLRRAAASGTPAVRLALVQSVEEIRENVRRFARDMDEFPQRRDALIRAVDFWVFDAERGLFAPAKFAGYGSMNFPVYERAVEGDATGARFDGHTTKGAIEKLVGPFEDSEQLRSILLAQLRGRTAVADIDGAARKWRFVQLPSVRRYWAFACNPDTFDGLAATRDLAEMAWTVGEQAINIGDRIAIWQAKGRGEDRGVVALGEITRTAVLEPSPPAESAYWRGADDGERLRVRLRVLPIAHLPLWESAAPWLGELAVARARGGTVFSLEPAQWYALAGAVAIDSIITGPVESPRQARGARQGYGLSGPQRVAVERHAQRLVEEHFMALGYQVRDVSRQTCYDLHCHKEDGEVHVEVKGTTGAGEAVLLTRNEVDHARKHGDKVALAIVSGITLDRAGPAPKASGGVLTLRHPWIIDEGELSPCQYEYWPRELGEADEQDSSAS